MSVAFMSLIPAVLPMILKPITALLPLCSLDLSPSPRLLPRLPLPCCPLIPEPLDRNTCLLDVNAFRSDVRRIHWRSLQRWETQRMQIRRIRCCVRGWCRHAQEQDPLFHVVSDILMHVNLAKIDPLLYSCRACVDGFFFASFRHAYCSGCFVLKNIQ